MGFQTHVICWENGASQLSFIWYVQFLGSSFYFASSCHFKSYTAVQKFLWGGEAEYKKAPLIAWDTACTPKKHGGLGVKNLNLWNNACIAKLVWAVAKKKDHLWILWVHGRYPEAGIGGFIHPKEMLAGIGRKSTESSNFSAVIQRRIIK